MEARKCDITHLSTVWMIIRSPGEHVRSIRWRHIRRKSTAAELAVVDSFVVTDIEVSLPLVHILAVHSGSADARSLFELAPSCRRPLSDNYLYSRINQSEIVIMYEKMCDVTHLLLLKVCDDSAEISQGLVGGEFERNFADVIVLIEFLSVTTHVIVEHNHDYANSIKTCKIISSRKMNKEMQSLWRNVI